MHITVDVASGQPRTRELEPATRCLIIFVSVDEQGRSTPVREFVPRTLGEELEQRWAARRADLRAQVEAAMAGQVYTDAGTAPRVVMRFLAAPTDVNWGGKVHGGIVMRWIDEAAHVLATQWTGSDRQRRDLHRRGAVLPPAADRARRRGRGPAAAHRAHVDARRGARALGRPGRRARRHGADDLLPHRLRRHRRASAARCRAPPGCRPTTRTGRWTPTPSSSCAIRDAASATDRIRIARPDVSLTFVDEVKVVHDAQ